MADNIWHDMARRRPRLLGAGLLVMAALASKYCVFDVLDQARSGVPRLHYSTMGVLGSGWLWALGLACVVLGKASVWLFQKEGQDSPARVAAGLLIIAIGAGFYWWFRQQMIALGYQVQL